MTKLHVGTFILAMAIYSSTTLAMPVELSAEGAYCTAAKANKANTPLAFLPAWNRESVDCTLKGLNQSLLNDKQCQVTEDQKNQAGAGELFAIAHELNSKALSEMAAPLYQRLNAAAAVGIDIGSFKAPLEKIAAFCSQPDLSGRGYSAEALRLQKTLSAVAHDRYVFSDDSKSDKYLRQFVVAAIETRRIQSVLQYLHSDLQNKKLAEKDVQKIQIIGQAHLARLLRIYYRYPALFTVGVFSGSSIQFRIENTMIDLNTNTRGPRSVFFSSTDLEEKLALNSEGISGTVLPVAPDAEDLDLPTGGEDFFPRLYEAVLSGRRIIPQVLRAEIIKTIQKSVNEALWSAQTKCQNITPCMALETHPHLAAEMIEQSGNKEKTGALACSCELGQSHEWINGTTNLALGFISAGAVLVATVEPVGWLPAIAYTLAFADSGAAASGMNDAYINVKRDNQITSFRAGGAVTPNELAATEEEYSVQRFNAGYNIFTGLIGIAPPAKIAARAAGATTKMILKSPEFITQSTIELSKAASGAPAPQPESTHYGATSDPRRIYAALPQDRIREQYPLLAAHLDQVAGLGEYADKAGDRYDAIENLKQAARQMMTSGNSHDQELLAKGLLRADLLDQKLRSKPLEFMVSSNY